jgi:hypothetical protein
VFKTALIELKICWQLQIYKCMLRTGAKKGQKSPQKFVGPHLFRGAEILFGLTIFHETC